MSTVPEAIVARQCGLKVAGISCITNLAAGRGGSTLTHAEVLETSERVKNSAALLLQKLRSCMAKVNKLDLVMAAVAAQNGRGALLKIQGGRGAADSGGRNHQRARMWKAPSYGLTCCAERVALFKALTEGGRNLWPWQWWRAPMAVRCPVEHVGSCAGGICAACCWTADSRAPRKIKEFTVAGILPAAFLKVP